MTTFFYIYISFYRNSQKQYEEDVTSIKKISCNNKLNKTHSISIIIIDFFFFFFFFFCNNKLKKKISQAVDLSSLSIFNNKLNKNQSNCIIIIDFFNNTLNNNQSNCIIVILAKAVEIFAENKI